MANHKSAIKRHKHSLAQQARNRANKTRVKNAVKAVRAALKDGDSTAAGSALQNAQAVLAKASGRGAIHWRNAARRVSRLAKAVNALAAK